MENKVSSFFWSQVLILIAIIFDLASFQFKERRKIIGCFVIAAILISIHFILLKQWTAAGLMGVAIVRYFTSIFTTSKKMMVFFSASSITVTSFTYMGITSLISCVGTLIQTSAAFSNEDKKLRQLTMLGTSFWLLHNYLVGSPTAVLMEMLFLSSNLIGYYRFYGKFGLNSV